MSFIKVPLYSILIFMTTFFFVLADNSGRINGRITTVDGDIFEGLIRWDKNEGSWVDIINGTKELPEKNYKISKRKRYRDGETSIEIFGITIGKHKSNTNWSWSNSAQSGIRFGHIKSMEVINDDEVLFVLKSGEELTLTNGSTDIGNSIREIIIEDDVEGEIELVWDDIETIDFFSARGDIESNFGDRLYGTLSTRRGEKFTGFVCWDIDELFTRDILDGDYKGKKRKIKFSKIESIERYSSSGALVTLINGDEILLRGSNDVDDDNRGIIISEPRFGQVIVDWNEFDKLEFTKAPDQVRYDNFDGGHPLMGTVYTEDDESFTGRIRWDNDEEFTWEILDGNCHGIEFDIEFGLITKIVKKSYRSAIVTIWDGRDFRLRGSNDVDEDNKGIYIILDNGEEVKVDWDDFTHVEFSRK